ncbi:LytR/AlgR family response regulator transcription factor [Clostridium sp. Marseille-P2415]|uniref:LytR/AlgR family response regulator transcription factor n=1 Tax=Clostridium sp. Marseille-P2415 TaxID=1805471 RepID=UPI0009884573|nr:LytTR family DNA-binding domain-containing protein [Clostridium sp. Marseille-P2415]
MLKIILCDDDMFSLTIFSELLQEAIDRLSISAIILCRASSTKELLNFLNKNPDDYFFFLDLDMGNGELNGLDLSRIIRGQYPASKIVFVTSHIEKSMAILKSGIEPFGFIEKDFNRKLMIREFENSLRLAVKTDLTEKIPPQKTIELIIGLDEVISIPVENIAYVEAVKTVAHNICYHTLDDSKITVRDTIKHALEMLGDDFVLSHRSVIVNKQYIIGTEHTQLKLSNGKLVACSISKKSFFTNWNKKNG